MSYNTVIDELNSINTFSLEIRPSVSVFGSARIHAEDPYYSLAKQIGETLAENGYSVISGGGPGIMSAVHEGAKSRNGYCVGVNIVLPFEKPQSHLQDVSLMFENFYTRKLAFASSTDAFVVMPGGMGTLDEMFEMLTLMQTGKMAMKPIVLVGTGFWSGLVSWMKEQLGQRGLVFESELERIAIVDDATGVLSFLKSQFEKLETEGETSPWM